VRYAAKETRKVSRLLSPGLVDPTSTSNVYGFAYSRAYTILLLLAFSDSVSCIHIRQVANQA
jgi:hypothetical protein